MQRTGPQTARGNGLHSNHWSVGSARSTC